MCMKPIYAVVAMAVMYGVLALMARSAPIFPDQQHLHDQERSLARLKRIRFEVELMPKELREVGLSAKGIRQRWSGRLEEAGLDLTGKDGDPVLKLIISSGTEPRVPGGVAFNPYLALIQKARIDSVDGELALPTYVDVRLGLESHDKLAAAANQVVNDMLAGFQKKYRRARGAELGDGR